MHWNTFYLCLVYCTLWHYILITMKPQAQAQSGEGEGLFTRLKDRIWGTTPRPKTKKRSKNSNDSDLKIENNSGVAVVIEHSNQHGSLHIVKPSSVKKAKKNISKGDGITDYYQ